MTDASSACVVFNLETSPGSVMGSLVTHMKGWVGSGPGPAD